MYESYKDFVSFITISEYNTEEQKIRLVFEHSLLPTTMHLNFKIPRIKKPGKYPFYFEKGMFDGLKGIIHVEKIDRKCLFLLTANWEGADSGYPDIVMEAFSQTLTRLALEKLIRISQF